MFFFIGCLWHGKLAQLSIHYENGFTLFESTTGSVGREPKKIWSYSFEKLKMSSDDNNRLLWLDFGDSSDIVSLIYGLLIWIFGTVESF